MALLNTLRKVGQGFSGIFLGLTGSWLLVICLGGLLTLGVLSLFHLGVLLSLGCIGICLLVAGACWLYGAISNRASPQSRQRTLGEDEDMAWPLDEKLNVEKNTTFSTSANCDRVYQNRKPRSDTNISHQRYNSLN